MRPLIRNQTIRRLLASIIFTAMLLAEVVYAGAVLKPVRTGAVGGAAWQSFFALEDNSVDVLVFGSSHAFSGIDPAVIWRERGIPSFILGGPAQMLQVTEYYMRESLRTQKPKVIAVEMASSSYSPRTFSPSFHAINIGLMPFSPNKLAASWFATPADMRVNILLDAWAYHGRWSEITKADFDLEGKIAEATYLKGFVPTMTSKAVSSTPYVRPQSDYPIANAGVAYNRQALRRIAKLLAQNDIELLLFLTPTGPPQNTSYYMDRAAKDLEAQGLDNIRVLDMSASGAVPGLSYKKDFRDGGHLNWRGAQKASATLADYLAETYGLPDRTGEAEYRSWDAAAAERDDYIKRKGGDPESE